MRPIAEINRKVVSAYQCWVDEGTAWKTSSSTQDTQNVVFGFDLTLLKFLCLSLDYFYPRYQESLAEYQGSECSRTDKSLRILQIKFFLRANQWN